MDGGTDAEILSNVKCRSLDLIGCVYLILLQRYDLSGDTACNPVDGGVDSDGSATETGICCTRSTGNFL